MWPDIILSLGTSVCEAVCINQLDQKKKEKYNNQLTSILQNLLGNFADTSLDCGEFHSFVSSSGFVHHIRMFFHTIYSNDLSTEPYRLSLEKYICDTFPNLNIYEVHEFIDKLSTLYESHLYHTIKENPAVDALFQMVVKANREAINKVIQNQERIIQYLSVQDSFQLTIDNEDVRTYHDTCEKEFGKIRFTGISGAENRRSQNIDDFYTHSEFSYCGNAIQNQYLDSLVDIRHLQLKDIFGLCNKVVLLGGAGLGKTTTLNYLYCNYEKLYKSCALKVKIDLKEYAKDIWEDKRDVLWCIACDFYKKTKRKNTQFETIEALLCNLLTQGNCLVIFDALDEITSQPMRDKVRDLIGNFSEIYFLNRFIISSREVGYLRNRFDESFLHIRINEFQPKQIQEYTYNWLKFNSPEKSFDEFWPNFRAEVDRARCQHLISNPIILILALVIFDIGKSLPSKRVELYKRCIDTFLEVREDRKGAWRFEEKDENILADDLIVPKIAHYKFMHADNDIRYRFTSEELENAVFEAIDVPDRIYWNRAVKRFSKYLLERTELIREIDEEILDFTHKTFFEYFLAVYYAKVCDFNTLTRYLERWVGDSNYDELARLIIEVIIQNNHPHQHQDMLNYLFTKVENNDNSTSKLTVNNFFAIVADLYSHNMLLAKYHIRYFECILYNAKLIKAPEKLRNRKTQSPAEAKYDSGMLAVMYCDAVLKKDKVAETLDALYYLDNEFRTNVINSIPEKKHVHIVKLLREVSTLNYSSKSRPNRELARELAYFTRNEDGLELTLKFPQIFLSVLRLMSFFHSYDRIGLLSQAKFSANNLFPEYVDYNSYVELLKQPIESSAHLVVVLTALINCSSKLTNYLLWCLFRHSRGYRNKKSEKLLDNAYWIYRILNYSSYDEFICAVRERELYDEKNEALLERLFYDYNDREKNYFSKELDKLIKENYAS